MKLPNLKRQQLTNGNKSFDYSLALACLVLTAFGIVMIYDASVVLAATEFNDSLFFFKNQIVWVIAGGILALFFSQVDYHFWQRYAKLFFVATLVSLLLVVIPFFSQQTYGARRRLNLPFNIPVVGTIGFQPSEIVKFTLIAYLASIFSKPRDDKKKTRRPASFLDKLSDRTLPFVAVLGVVIFFIMKQPDLGTTVVVGATATLLYIFSGAGFFESFILFVGGILAAGIFVISSSYRRSRLLSFLNPSADTLGISYHINQALIALGSGGLFGLGLGFSRQKYQYLPEVTTDSIFAIIGEELGFIGTFLTIVALIFIVYRGIEIVRKTKDPFGRLLSFGIVSTLAVQTFLNLGSMVAIIPLTGVPLPFVSYGGSNMLVMLLSVGVLLNISKSA